jgi:hypothetical protein
MKPILVLAMLALCLAACAPKPAANSTAAAANGANGCPAPGFGPGSPGYQDCVNALAGESAPEMANAAQMRAQIQNQIAQQQAQMHEAMSNSSAGCTTTRDANNNVTTQCP